MKRFFTIAASLLVMVACVSNNNTTATETESTQPTVAHKDPSTIQEIVDELKAGNARFMKNDSKHYHNDMDYVKSLNDAQHPFATVIACSDSRVPTELLFDQGFGDLFVIRTAGNSLIDNVTLGSVDYAINHLHTKVIVVLGHTNCGAVTAIVNMGHDHHKVEHDEEVGKLLNNIASHIPQHKGTEKDLDKAIVDNVDVQVEQIMERDFIKEKVSKGELLVLPAVYHLDNGEVQFL